ncbi:hypothetical protein [Clostridium thermosuccinogenes]|nr:hypothetical protein [Pseudoclostridium thermosuccinogenes]
MAKLKSWPPSLWVSAKMRRAMKYLTRLYLFVAEIGVASDLL